MQFGIFLCKWHKEFAGRPGNGCPSPLPFTRADNLTEISLALADRAFLRHRGHQRAVLLENQAAGQTA
ncbi:MAG TPA: hypothetical protein VN065_11610, partial [Bradyrhizobium sp.]|nr:hypothetical protein [Bradyrhizobium sp.]